MPRFNDLDKEYYDRRRQPADDGGSRKTCKLCGNPAADHPVMDGDEVVCAEYE